MGTVVVNGVSYVDPSPTGTVRWSDIAATTSNSYTSLSQLRGKKWYKSDFTRGTHPTSPSAISFSSFRGKGGNIPRVDRTAWPAAGKFFASGNITLPPGFNTVSFVMYGGGGGGGGGNSSYIGGFNNGLPIYGAAGSSGGTTSITTAAGTYSATGGGGGNQGGAGGNGSPDPGAATDYIPGGTGYGNGGKGGRNYTATTNADTDWATAAAMFSQNCSTSYGGGGGGGGGANGLSWISTGGSSGYYTLNGINGASGNPGSAGGITVFVDAGLY